MEAGVPAFPWAAVFENYGKESVLLGKRLQNVWQAPGDL